MSQAAAPHRLFLAILTATLTGLTFLAVTLGSNVHADTLRPEDQKTVALGQQIYVKHCAECHGANLEGQPNWRKRLPNGRLPAPPHDVSGHTWHHPDQVLITITKSGPAAIAGDDYESDMPGYDGVLSDTEIIAVLSYIKSRWPADIRRAHSRRNSMSKR